MKRGSSHLEFDEVTEMWFEQQQQPIGGVGKIFEIDDIAISRGKYNQGRPLKKVRVFSGVERVIKKKFIVPLVSDTLTKAPIWTLFVALPQSRSIDSAVNHSRNDCLQRAMVGV